MIGLSARKNGDWHQAMSRESAFMRKQITHPAAQRGVAALAVALIIIVLLTLVTLFAARVGVMEQRTSANEFRAREAFDAAEAGIEQGLAFLGQNRRQISSTATGGWMQAGNVKWATCAADDATVPCGDGNSTNLYPGTDGVNMLAFHNVENEGGGLSQPVNGSYTLHYLVADDDADGNPDNPPVMAIVAEGVSEDSTGNSVIRQGIYFYPFQGAGPDVPLMAQGTISGGGNFHVVVNPNAGGTGVPLSTWSGNNVDLSGSGATCNLDEFLTTDAGQTTDTFEGDSVVKCPACTCPATDAISSVDGGTYIEGYDVLDVDGHTEGVNPDTTDFPSDLFEYVFGVPLDEWQSVKDEAQQLTDCSTLNANSSGLYWIVGNCSINQNIGSFAAPVLLVVEGETKANANVEIFGLIFAFSPTGTGTLKVQLNGGPTMYGAVISNANVDLGNGTYRMRYDSSVLERLGYLPSGRGLGKIPGSWADFLN